MKEEQKQPDTAENSNAFQGRRILMAEDNEINAMIAVEILWHMGAKVDVAENGQEVDICAVSRCIC